MLSVRLFKDEDRAAIDQLIRAAFVSPGAGMDSVQEAPLVATLRANGDVLLELVLVTKPVQFQHTWLSRRSPCFRMRGCSRGRLRRYRLARKVRVRGMARRSCKRWLTQQRSWESMSYSSLAILTIMIDWDLNPALLRPPMGPQSTIEQNFYRPSLKI